jgi:hypothetical protein
VQGGTPLSLGVEECEIPPEAVLELNVGTEEAQTSRRIYLFAASVADLGYHAVRFLPALDVP